MSTMYRHGDVLLVRLGDCAANGSRRVRRMVVAEGEVTGHSHVITAPGRFVGDRLSLPEGGTITHEEHHEIVLEPGDYQVVHQQQFTQIGHHLQIRRAWSRVRD